MTQIKNFSRDKREPLRFQIDDDVFEAAPTLGAELLRSLIFATTINLDPDVLEAAASGDLTKLDPERVMAVIRTTEEQTGKTMQFLDTVLFPDSAARFAERMRSATNPITIEQATDVYRWLLGEYGARPTQPSKPSSLGLDGTGTSSTAGVQVVESIPSS